MAMNGTDLLLLCNTSIIPGIIVYEAVGCQRDATLDEATATIDVSCKESRAQRVLPGRYSGTVSLDALYVPTDAAYMALRDANRNGDMILIAREEYGVAIETVNAKIDTISESFPDQGEAVISVSLTIDDFWALVGS